MREPTPIFWAKPCPAQNNGLCRARAHPFCAGNFKGDIKTLNHGQLCNNLPAKQAPKNEREPLVKIRCWTGLPRVRGMFLIPPPKLVLRWCCQDDGRHQTLWLLQDPDLAWFGGCSAQSSYGWRTAAGKIVLEHGCIGRADWFAKRTLETTITKKTGAVVGVSFVAAFNKRGRHKSWTRQQ